jgi:hypothetical protein
MHHFTLETITIENKRCMYVCTHVFFKQSNPQIQDKLKMTQQTS